MEKLQEIQKNLSEKDKKQIIKEAKELEIFQKVQEEEDIEILPKVTLADVPKNSRYYALHNEKVGPLNLFFHNTFTNEIIYADLILPLPEINEEELPYVQLYASLITQMGSGGRSYSENLDYMQAHTGGVGSSAVINVQATDSNIFHPYFCLHGKALYRNAEKLFLLIRDIATSVDFNDKARLKEIIMKKYTSLEHGLTHSALRYAIGLSASGLSTAAKVTYDWNGLGFFFMMRDLAHDYDANEDKLIRCLKQIQNKLSTPRSLDLILGCDEKMYNQLKSHQFYGLQTLQLGNTPLWKGDFPIQSVRAQGRTIASPVAFTARVFRSVPYSHPDTAALCIAAHIFDNVTIHKMVREIGGAYGGGATNNALSGNFYFYSYRDPNIASTLDAFEQAVNEIVNGRFDEADLEEAKLEIVQSLDSPTSPGSRGHLAYSWMREGRTLELRQKFRDRLLSATREEVIAVVKKHVLPNLDKSTPISFAGKELLQKENVILAAAGKQPLEIFSV